VSRKKKLTRETNPFSLNRPKYDERKYIRWVDPFTAINQGKLGSSRVCVKKKNRSYYW